MWRNSRASFSRLNFIECLVGRFERLVQREVNSGIQIVIPIYVTEIWFDLLSIISQAAQGFFDRLKDACAKSG